MNPSNVILDIDSRGVANLRLNRADKHNAFDDAVIAELDSALQRIASDNAIRVVVLGSAGRSFSAGADLGWMQRMAGYSCEENQADARALAEMLRKLNNLPQATIARVQGAAYGGAVGLVSCCDLALGTEHAKFCLSEVKIGLIPATISPYVIAALGARAARRYFMTAEIISASEACQLGLLSEVVATDALDGRIEHYITTLLNNGPQAVRAAKRLVLDYAELAIDAELIEDSCQRIAAIRVSAEGQAGLGAFLNKAAAPWSTEHV